MFEQKRISRDQLYDFLMKVLQKVGCKEFQASAVADVCLEADMRGISSHGVARLPRYVDHIQKKLIQPEAEPEILFQTGVSAVYDGHHGVGQYVAKIVCEKAVHMAQKNGVGISVVRNSNHYGIAGYWAEQIMKNEMIGMSTSNTAPLVVPTFGSRAVLGTNPISVAIPSYYSSPIMLDMATSVVSRGKLEVFSRNKKPIPHGWAVDANGKSTDDPAEVLDNLKKQTGGGLVPLGGETTTHGGHKGFGLSFIAELLTAGLSLGASSLHTYKEHGNISHFFMAIRLDLFGDSNALMEHMHQIALEIKQTKPSLDHSEIYIHNELEYRSREDALKNGIKLDIPTYIELKKIAEQFVLNL